LIFVLAADFGSAAIAWPDRAMLLNNRRCCVRMAFSLGDCLRFCNSRAIAETDEKQPVSKNSRPLRSSASDRLCPFASIARKNRD
jgi:hypothetical protein